MYLDAAHGGWLGWDNNIKLFSTALKGGQGEFAFNFLSKQLLAKYNS